MNEIKDLAKRRAQDKEIAMMTSAVIHWLKRHLPTVQDGKTKKRVQKLLNDFMDAETRDNEITAIEEASRMKRLIFKSPNPKG